MIPSSQTAASTAPGGRAPDSGAAPSPLAIVFCAALAAGLGELLVRLLLRGIASSFDNSFYLNPQAVWMGGLANLPLFALLGGGAWWLAHALGRPSPWRWALVTVTFVAALEIVLVSRRVHVVAQVIVAAGVAWHHPQTLGGASLGVHEHGKTSRLERDAPGFASAGPR